MKLNLFWNAPFVGWRLYGLWINRRIYLGVSIIPKKKENVDG